MSLRMGTGCYEYPAGEKDRKIEVSYEHIRLSTCLTCLYLSLDGQTGKRSAGWMHGGHTGSLLTDNPACPKMHVIPASSPPWVFHRFLQPVSQAVQDAGKRL